MGSRTALDSACEARITHEDTMFSAELERDSFRTSNGEYGWTRDQMTDSQWNLVVNNLVVRKL
jgi:hypothetical protein